MAAEDTIYISGDSHLEIDSKYWIERVPKLYRDRVPRVIKLPDGGDAWLAENSPLTENPFDLYGGKGRENWWPFGQSYETTAGTGTAQQRLREQDQDGIAAEVLFPGVAEHPRRRRLPGGRSRLQRLLGRRVLRRQPRPPHRPGHAALDRRGRHDSRDGALRQDGPEGRGPGGVSERPQLPRQGR